MSSETAHGAWAAASGSEAETETLGARLGEALAPGDLVALAGPLGAGKTRFVAGVARGLEARARVRSPTFTLVNEYRGRIPLRHVDLYRLEGRQVEALGLELAEGRDEVALVVEWAEKLPADWLADALRVEIGIEASGARVLRATAAGARAERLLASWREAVAEPGGGA